LPSRAVILTLSHPRQGGLSSAENHHRLHRAKKDTFSPAERARGRTKRTRMPPRVLSNENYTQPVGPRRTLVDRSSAPVVVHAAALNEVHHAAGRIWQREGGGFDGLAAVALAGSQHRFIITAKSSEKCPLWPPAPAARLTPHSAFTPCGDESLNISKIFSRRARTLDFLAPLG